MLKLAIETTNSAFGSWTAQECARILRELADRLEGGETGGSLRDVNGNRVGSFTLKQSKED